MRLITYLNQLLYEWKVEKKYAGRGVGLESHTGVIMWYNMIKPINKGLIWTLPNGDTYLDDKKIGNINYPNKKLTHKKQLSEFYTKLGFGKKMSGNLRQDVEDMNEANIRGRIVGKTIYVYSYSPYDPMEAKRHDNLINNAINAIYEYIPEDYNEI